MSLKPLRIPYAIDVERNCQISADEIAEIMADVASTTRLRATARKDTATRKIWVVACPACHQRVYPRAPWINGGRYFWSHLPGQGDKCPLESKRRRTPEEISALIFHGRQEGEHHKNLVSLLVRLAENDPSIDRNSITRGTYEKPSDDMRAEFPYGRFPDVQFLLGQTKVILEAQLATITLHGINGRRAFYDRLGARLLWVMKNFDPSGSLKASVKDIVADQGGILFSIDKEIEDLSCGDCSFRLREWRYQSNDGAGEWSDRIVTIAEAVNDAKQVRWCDDFKKRWIELYKDGYYSNPEAPDPMFMLNEAAQKAGLSAADIKTDAECLLALLRLFISLEATVVTGSTVAKIISLANRFDQKAGGHKATTLVRKAIVHWQPELLDKPSMEAAFKRAGEKLKTTGDIEWRRKSCIGRLRDVLFPDWKI